MRSVPRSSAAATAASWGRAPGHAPAAPLWDDLGVPDAVRVARGPAGLRRTTEFSSGETASLVAFAEGTSARLGWQLDLRAGPAAHYAAVVDATTGKVLYRANRVK